MAEWLPISIDQGEDFTAEIVWTDQYDEPVEVQHPCRMQIKAENGQVFVDLETDPEIPDGDVPGLAISPSMGLIQIHIPHTQTQAMLAGINYFYDIFVTLGDQSSYGGPQRDRILYGPVEVNKRTTVM